jgi:hypothetical protein
MIWGIALLLLGTEGAIVERGLLPTLSYMGRKRERERERENLSVLRIESAQQRSVPGVLDVRPYLGVA